MPGLLGELKYPSAVPLSGGPSPVPQIVYWAHSATSFLLATISCLNPASAVAHFSTDTLPGTGSCYMWYIWSSFWFSTLHPRGCEKALTRSQCLLGRGPNLLSLCFNLCHTLAAPPWSLFLSLLVQSPLLHQRMIRPALQGCTSFLQHSLQIAAALEWVAKPKDDSVDWDQGWPWLSWDYKKYWHSHSSPLLIQLTISFTFALLSYEPGRNIQIQMPFNRFALKLVTFTFYSFPSSFVIWFLTP